MIKRIRLATSKSGLGPEEFGRRLGDAVAAAATAPAAARPARLTVATALLDVDADQQYDGVGLEWFTGEEHLLRYEAWLATPDGQAAQRRLGEAADLDASPVVLADERVVRGADWLEQRWQGAGQKVKQLAIATRAHGLTLPQFQELWRSRAGKIGAAPIPDAFRGQAYIQNHPLVRAGRDWAYDAVNEVYFDNVDGLLARMGYFRENLTDTAEEDLVSKGWFLAVREQPVELPGK